MKKLLLVAVVLLLLGSLFLVACRDPGVDPEPGEDEVPAVDGIDLSKYTLMRADMASTVEKNAVMRIRKAFRAMYDLEIEVKTEYDRGEDGNAIEYEFIVGHVGIPEEDEVYRTLADNEFAIVQSGNKLILVGGTPEATDYGVIYFLRKYTGYNADQYEVPKMTWSPLPIEDERGFMPEQIVMRDTTLDAVPEGERINIHSTDFTFSACKEEEGAARFENATGLLTYKGTTGEGSYSISMRVDIESAATPIMQLFFNTGTDAKHVVLSVNGNYVGVGRPDYERGGASFVGDAKHYTLRAEVYPSAGCMRYYVNDVFLGEMNIADNDYPLLENSGFSIAAVTQGASYTAYVSEVTLASLEDIDPRRYDANFDTVVTDEEVYPKSQNAPAQTIYVVDPSTLNDDDLLTLMTLQGNVNRTTPEIFVDYRKYNNDPHYNNITEEAAYLEMLESKGRTLIKAKLDELLVKYADRYAGIIIGDAFGANNYEENIITTLCGVLDGVYLSQSRYDKFKDDLKKDVLFRTNDKFASSVDAYMWVWENYGDRCSETVLFHMGVGSDQAGHPTMICRDYAVMTRSFVFCTDDVLTLADYDFYMEIMASTAPNTGIFGQSGGCFPEFEMFQICGQFGKYFTYGFSTPNMSLLNSLEVGELKQPEYAIPAIEKNTVYVTFDLSEGDNLSWDYHLWMFDYDNIEGREAVAKGYSICGALYYVAPAILEYYYQNATINDNFFLDGGGISNLSSPDDFGILYWEGDREKVVDRMLELTEYVAQKTDIHVIRALHNISDEMTARYDEECPSILAVASAYGNTTAIIGGIDNDYKKATYMVGDIVRERCAYTTFHDNIAQQVQKGINATKNTDNIYFARVFVYANPMLDNLAHFTDLKSQLETLNYNVKIVTPEVYAQLYKTYAENQ